MVITTVEKTDEFVSTAKKIKDKTLKDRLQKQIIKIIENPETGKPMMYHRKGTREVYVPPFRLSYLYNKEENKIILLELYHKDEQ
jgi:mRNA-degrading endonuclease RelE of RelBE toxin-antitoxin system